MEADHEVRKEKRRRTDLYTSACRGPARDFRQGPELREGLYGLIKRSRGMYIYIQREGMRELQRWIHIGARAFCRFSARLGCSFLGFSPSFCPLLWYGFGVQLFANWVRGIWKCWGEDSSRTDNTLLGIRGVMHFFGSCAGIYFVY